jgi:hypothetical protein
MPDRAGSEVTFEVKLRPARAEQVIAAEVFSFAHAFEQPDARCFMPSNRRAIGRAFHITSHSVKLTPATPRHPLEP